MKRGDVYWAVLAPRSGSEQQSRRPVIVVSHDGFNQTLAWRSVIVVPISSSGKQAGRGPTAVPLPKASTGACPAILQFVLEQRTTGSGVLVARCVNEIPRRLRVLGETPRSGGLSIELAALRRLAA